MPKKSNKPPKENKPAATQKDKKPTEQAGLVAKPNFDKGITNR
jgi:hypothetical protein